MVEMLVVMLIAGVLAALAIPAFQTIIQTNRTSAEINTLVNDLQFARAEAQRLSQTVSVCASGNGSTCSGNSTNWQSGWIVFSDLNASLNVDANDVILRVQVPFTGTDTLVGDASLSGISYNRLGLINNATSIRLRLNTTPVNADATRCLVNGAVGMLTVQTRATAPTCQ